MADAGCVCVDELSDRMLRAAEAEISLARCYNVRDEYEVSRAVLVMKFRRATAGQGFVIDPPFRAEQAARRRRGPPGPPPNRF